MKTLIRCSPLLAGVLLLSCQPSPAAEDRSPVHNLLRDIFRGQRCRTRTGGYCLPRRIGPRGRSNVLPRLAGHSRSSATEICRRRPGPRKLIYATYLGGSQNEFTEHRPALLQDGSFLLTGSAGSPDFPATAAAFQRKLSGKTDGFLTKLSAGGKTFAFSTLLGGSRTDFWLMPTRDRQGNIFIAGQTSSTDLPVTPDALQQKYGGGESDGALAIVSPDGSKLLYATYLGGNGNDMIRGLALGERGEVYLVGNTSSADFPVTTGAAQSKFGGAGDAFVMKLVKETSPAGSD